MLEPSAPWWVGCFAGEDYPGYKAHAFISLSNVSKGGETGLQ